MRGRESGSAVSGLPHIIYRLRAGSGGGFLTNRPVRKSDKPESSPAPKPEEERPAGLCSVCIHSSTCAYLKSHKEGAIFCEMFEGEDPDSSKGKIDGPAVAFRSAANVADPEKIYQGLCVNCFHRTRCSLATSHGGVWHCEEYQLE
ncbi:hypothetical protein TRIP_C20424 [Candidatus Zixiibacteriota bacterium]|nr:hypothetical protein TRIP_C20424 [candidate division Zixibacteria bacterium]